MYKPGATNHADALTRWEQDLDSQIAKKIALWTQTLLGPEHLDPRIQAELDKDLLSAELCSIDKSGLDFIDELLQANCTATSLQEYHEEAKDGKGKWTLENGLLKHQEQLVVDWLDQTVIFSLDQTGPKNFSLVLDFWDWTVKWSPLFDGTRLYMVRS